MGALEFAVDVVTFGSVLGVGPRVGPEEVCAVLGGDFGENRQKHLMWRDFGLVEFFWERESGSDPWQGTHFSVQFHRLTWLAADGVGEAIGRRYGSFGSALDFEELRAALDGAGVPLEELHPASPDVREYWQAESQAAVLVQADGEDAGTVFRITAPLSAEMLALRGRQLGSAWRR